MYKHFFKRFFDFWISLIALICISPILVIVTIWLHFANKGAGAFFFQERPGKDAKIFKVIKFKTMTDERGLDGELLPDAQRLTKVGKFVRSTSIDELPQLINILNGTMSIIGPRPVAEDQFDMFRYGKWNEAAKVPVGLSGPAALYDYIYGDQITDEKEYMEKVYPTRRELEYTYVQKAGVFYDLKMIVYTVICILYALAGKECTWILNELKADAAASANENPNENEK